MSKPEKTLKDRRHDRDARIRHAVRRAHDEMFGDLQRGPAAPTKPSPVPQRH
jgi:hypothetical protein